MLETALLVELANRVESSFLCINSLLLLRKQQMKNVKKVFPVNNQRQITKFQNRQRANSSRSIDTIIDTHYKTTMVSELINVIFGIPILLTLAINLQSITLTLYFSITVLQNFEKLFLIAIAEILWALCVTGQTVLIVSSLYNLTTMVKLDCSVNCIKPSNF